MKNKFIGNPKVGGLLSKEATQEGFERFGLIYKHCRPEHLPASGRKLRIGALSEYRVNENVFVRDARENTFNLKIRFAGGVYLDFDKMRQITINTFPQIIGFATNNLYTSVFHGLYNTSSVFSTDSNVHVFQSDGNRYMRGELDLHAEGADALVLCLSTKANPAEVIDDHQYSAVWSIRPGYILDFVKYTTRYILQNFPLLNVFRKETVGPLRAPGFPFPPEKSDEPLIFSISSEIWKVTYRDKTITVSCEIGDSQIFDVQMCIDQSFAIKDLNFAKEEEVRILFRPCVYGKKSGKRYLFPLKVNPIYIPFEGLLSFIRIE